MYYNSTYFKDTACCFPRDAHIFSATPYFSRMERNPSFLEPEWNSATCFSWAEPGRSRGVSTLTRTALSKWGFSLSLHFLPLLHSLWRQPSRKAILPNGEAPAMCGH